MPQITPNNLAFAANGVFTTGGSVTFGYENVPGDPEAPATLKGIFVDEAQTVAALNPQPLDSDAKYQQSATGILYGPGAYSVLVRNSLGVQVAYNPSYSGAIGKAAAYNVGTGADEIPLNSDLGTSSTKDTGTGTTQVPQNSDLGTSSTKDTGTGADEIPLNSDLGSSATKDIGTANAEIPLNADILHYNSVLMLGSPSGSQVTPFTGWNSPYATLSLEFTTTSGTAWASKSSAERELLTAMGRENVQHISQDFNVYRVVINSGREGAHAGPYARINVFNQTPITIAAFTKLLTGNAPAGYYANGMSSVWGLTGDHKPGQSSNYIHCHPYGNVSNSACTFLVALPGAIMGYVDLTNPLNWWMFPNKSGGEG